MTSYEMTKYPIKKRSDIVIEDSTPGEVLPVLKGGLPEAQILKTPQEELTKRVWDVIKIYSKSRPFTLQNLFRWLGVKPRSGSPVYQKIYASVRELIRSGVLEVTGRGKYAIKKKVEETKVATITLAKAEVSVQRTTEVEDAGIYKRALELLSAIKSGDINVIEKISPELALLIRMGLVEIKI